jgi:ABC-type glycerol-3-phosphate transport system permease component
MKRTSILRVVQKVALYAILVVAVIASVLPLMWAFASSLRPPAETFSYTTPFTLEAIIPTRFDLSAYTDIIEDGFARNVLNSVFVSGAVVLGGLFVNSLAAFGFAVFNFKGKRPLFALVLATFLVSLEVIVVPLFLVVRSFGWIDSYAALIMPALADAFAIFLLTTAFLDVPRDLIDAARVDGASWFTVYRRVTLPLNRPALATAGLFMFIASWDAFFWPLVATRSAELGVVQLGVNRYITSAFIAWDQVFASSIIASGIVLVLFLVLQRFYLKGIALTGLK